ncbi:hypothetical protein X943_003751 [Babesia divergens]|uniref:Uncharacterized protein n=1 Tax=Babesia divergens TaxID=32595 RepID=A0AAD9GAS6_BABDI|nr:hypothetical protein X943_003751 [Babesia divergens]
MDEGSDDSCGQGLARRHTNQGEPTMDNPYKNNLVGFPNHFDGREKHVLPAPYGNGITKYGRSYSRSNGQRRPISHVYDPAYRYNYDNGRMPSINVDEMVEEAFQNQPRPVNLCAMACRGSVKDELINRMLSRLAAHTKKRRNAPHILYVCKTLDALEDFTMRYSEDLSSLGKANIISSNRIKLTPNSLITICDSWSFFYVHTILNVKDTKDIALVIDALRSNRHLRCNRNKKGVMSGSIESNASITSGSDDLEPEGRDETELMFGESIVDESNQEDFTLLLRKLIGSFTKSHEDILEHQWSSDVDTQAPKEALFSFGAWMQRSYQTPEQLSERLLLDEAGKRLVMIDGFNYSVSNDSSTVTAELFDETLVTLRKECQVVALSPGLFSPQNISQWVKRIHSPMEFCTAQKWPEFRLFYGKRHFDPFASKRKVRYAWKYTSAMRQMLTSNKADPTYFFNTESDKPGCMANAPWNDELKFLIKDVIKDVLAVQGVDTLHKLKHVSREGYDYIKQHIRGRPQVSYEHGMTNLMKGDTPQNSDYNREANTIDNILDNIIDLENYKLGSTFIHRVLSRESFSILMKEQLHSVVDRIIEDGIFPAVIYTRSEKIMELYRYVLNGRFPVSEAIKQRLKECGLENIAPDMFLEGIATTSEELPPEVVKFVLDNINLFNIVVSAHPINGTRHYICHKPTIEGIKRYHSRIMTNIQQGSLWLGAERITYWGLFPLDVVHSLATLMVHTKVDFSGYNPYGAIEMWKEAMPEEVRSNNALIEKLVQMTFANHMNDCRTIYSGNVDEPLQSRSYGSHIRVHDHGNGIPMHSSTFRPQVVHEGGGIPPNGTLSSSHMALETPMRQRDPTLYRNAMEDHRARREDTPVYSSNKMGPQHMDDTVEKPVIRSMIDRYTHLKYLESKLKVAGVDMQPLYILDQKMKRARRFDIYTKGHIQGLLKFKCRAIGMIHDAVSLSGSEVIGCDGRTYTMVWFGRPDVFSLPNYSVATSVQQGIEGFFQCNSQFEMFCMLKHGDDYICTPAFFIKDILSLPKPGSPMVGSISQFTSETVPILQPPGIPLKSMPAQMPYLVLTAGENKQMYALPSSLHADMFLMDTAINLVRISQETLEYYHKIERELIEDAVVKLMNCNSLGIENREQAISLLNETREVHRKRDLGGLEPYLRHRQAMDRSWGSGNGNGVTPVYNKQSHKQSSI